MLTTLIPAETRKRLAREAKLLGHGWSVLVSTASTVAGIIGWLEVRRGDKP